MIYKGYIFRGTSGWTVAVCYAFDTDYFFGFKTWDSALSALKEMWGK